MSDVICNFNFNITNWNVASDKVITDEHWLLPMEELAQVVKTCENYVPSLSFLPPLKRRRLNGAARLFFEAAWDLTLAQPNIPVVYASGNGEINRSFALWLSLLQEGDISPTSFSLSIHNALVGQWSELRQVQQEITALDANQDNLEIALLEAYMLLQEGASQVLVAVAENPLATEYAVSPIYRQPFAYVLAMIVEKGSQYQLSATTKGEESLSLPCCDNALNWIKQQKQGTKSWVHRNSSGGYWHWLKK